jgi:tripartite-type tricarboxylate transporter receptor subunit TctC
MPQPIVDKLNAALNKAIQTPGFKSRFAAIGDEPAGGTPKDLADTIARDSAKWKDVVARSGAKLD